MELYKDLIVGRCGIYKATPLTDSLTIDDLSMDYAYIKEPYYYLYRGIYISEKRSVLPGIYKTIDDKIKIVEPTLAEDKKEYATSTHWSILSKEEIVKAIAENEEDFSMYADGKNLFLPEILPTDDPLKRGIKEALHIKGVDIDSCKDRFSDRNALFNFKSVVKSDNKMSTLLFERGCDALNLDYYVTLVERNPNASIGAPLNTPETMEKLEKLRKRYNIKTDGRDLSTNAITVSNTDMHDITA